jgi:hypothetical protein
MPQQRSIRDESWQPDPRFLEDVADEVHGLVFPPAPAANEERFRAQIAAAIQYQRLHDEARAELDRREGEHRKKVEQEAPLRDRQAGPPADGWGWDEEFLIEWSHKVEEGAWVPPGFPTESDLPPEPVRRHGSPKDMPWEVLLTGQYVTLAIVHDDADAANRRGHPELLTDFDLPPSFRLLLERAPHSRKKLKVGGFDRATIKRALKDVKADLAKHLATGKPRNEELRAALKVPPDVESLALKVDNLYHQDDNSRVFAEQIEAFKRQGAEHLARRKRAEARVKEAVRNWVSEVADELEGRSPPRLTGDKPPAEGYVRAGKAAMLDVQGQLPGVTVGPWMPQELRDRYRDHLEHEAWPADGSLPAMFALLAALRDMCSPPDLRILPGPGDSSAGPVSGDLRVAALESAHLWVAGARGDGGKARLKTLRWYLNEVKAYLSKQSGRGGGVELEAGKGARRVVDPPPPPEGEWSLPASLTDFANRLGNMTTDKARTFLERTGLRKVSRQQWQVRLDTLDTRTRHLIVHGRPPDSP